MRARANRDYPEVAKLFRLIDEEGQETIVVPYGDAEKRLTSYSFHPGRDTFRALQPYLVKVSTTQFNFLNKAGMIAPINEQMNRLTRKPPSNMTPGLALSPIGSFHAIQKVS